MIEKELAVVSVLNKTKFALYPLEYQYYDEYSYFDCKSKYAIVELKHRDFELNRYTDYILERDKYKRLMKEAFDNRKKFWYINSFESGEIIGWNVTNLYLFKQMPPIQTLMCPATTEFDNNEKIEKEVYFLKLDCAEHIGNLPKSV